MGKPISKEEFISRHSAFYQGMGFDIQFAAFIRYMFDLSFEDVIYYETEDDFVIDRNKNRNTIKEYYQVKHSKDAHAKMTNADSDFWKTLDNWIDIYDLTPATEQKDFFLKGRFIILTNKEVDNEYYDYIIKLRDGVCNIDDVFTKLRSAISQSPSYKSTLEKMVRMDKSILNQFFHKVEIIRFEDFLGSMYERFLLLYRNPTMADSILNELVGKIWRDKQSSNGKFHYTFEEFSKKYKGIIEKIANTDSLTLEHFEEPDLDKENEDEAEMMIEQLRSVAAIGQGSSKEDDSCAYYLSIFFKIQSAILSFRKQEIITDELENRLNKSAIQKWKGIFIKHHRKISQDEKLASKTDKVDAGLATLDETMEAPIFVSGYDVNDDFAKGWYLRLSNVLKITWHFDWYKKYIQKT